MLLANKEKGKSALAVKVTLYLVGLLLGTSLFVKLFADMPQTKPDLDVKVTVFEPSGWIDRETNITVKFSRDMVPDDSLDKPVLDVPIDFNPETAGIGRWIEKNIFRFYPENKLRPATKYTARVKSDNIFLYGNKIDESRKFEFQTANLAVKDFYYEVQPVDKKSDSGQIIINLTFNYQVTAENLKKQLSIKGVGNKKDLDLKFDVNLPNTRPRSSLGERWKDQLPGQNFQKATITTEKIGLYSERQTYQLLIKNNLTCSDCTLPMSVDYSNIIRVEPKRRFVINRVYPQGVGSGYNIQVNLSLTPDIERAKDFVTIDPPVVLEFEQRGNNLILHGEFKSGKTYEINIQEGMPSIKGTVLENEFSTILTVPDLAPSIKFTSEGIFLPDSGNGLIEIETINLDTVSIEVEEIFANNIVHFLNGGYSSSRGYGQNITSLGRSFFIKDIELHGMKNEKLQTTIDLAGIIGQRTKGIFKISVRNKKGRWLSDSRYTMLTNIGVSARMASDYLMVWANSLSEIEPISGAEVKLISRNNQVLITGHTDSRGIIIFDDIESKIDGFDPFVLLITYDNDKAYLRFDQCRLPISDFDVDGRPFISAGYESFVYTDRGLYRPGDSIHIVSITRGFGCSLPDSFPIGLTILDPSGKTFKQFRASTGGQSYSAIDYRVPEYARTGKYSAVVKIGEDYEIGRVGFLVEEFMPDRIKVTVETERKSYQVGETVNIDVIGKFLFGPPAAGHDLSGHITIEEESFSASGYSDFIFNDNNKQFSRQEINLPDDTLDFNGYHTYKYAIPDKLKAPSILKALISATVSEQGGRAIGGYNGIKIFPYNKYVGIKLDLNGYAKIGVPVEFDLAAVDFDGQKSDIDSVEVRLYRSVYHTIMRKDKEGYYRYISEETVQPKDSSFVSISKEGLSLKFTPNDYGRYSIVATDIKGGHSTSTSFYASGWGYAPWAKTSPDKIEIGLDQDVYSPGDKAKIQIRAPFGGKLLLTVEKDKVLDFITIDMKENTAEIELPVNSDYFPNVYISATVIRPATEIKKSSPGRAFGLAPLILSKKENNIVIDMQMPEVIKPNSKLNIDLFLTNETFSELTLALVDEGILQLTDYQTPDPLDYFFGKRRPHLDLYDNYSFVFPNIEKQESHFSPAGGRMFSETRKRHLNPIRAQRIKPIALWSGIIETDRYGKSSLQFDIPQFNGTLKAIVVAVNKNRFGSAEKSVTVRDNIVIQESFPRFVAPNDEVNGLVSIFNNTGFDANIEVELKLDGPVSFLSPAAESVFLKNNSEGEVVFKFKSDLKPEKINCTIIAKTVSNQSVISFELANRPAQPLYTEYGSGSVTKDRAAVFEMPKDWVEGTDRYILKTSSLPATRFVRNIEYLLSYPYGCLEQTTSKVFPLLYFGDLVRFVKPDLIGTKGAEYFIQEGILRLTGFMKENGYFSYWPGGESVNNWSSIYASHFLIEAKNAGYFLDKATYKKIIANLFDVAEEKNIYKSGDACRIYAAYVLGKAGEIKKRTLNYLKKLDPTDLSPYSRYQLAGALAMAGEIDLAFELLPGEMFPETFEPETGGNLSSGVRTNAILLDVLLEIDPKNSSIPVLVEALSKDAQVGRWYNTQQNSFALMALGKYFSKTPRPDFQGDIRIGGEKRYNIDTSKTEIIRQDLGGETITIAIEGEGNCYYYWQASGVSTSHAPEEFSRGIKVNKRYYNELGQEIKLDSITLGDQIICKITAEATDKTLSNVVINDLLPAGFEIENPRLKTTPRLSWIPTGSSGVDYMDIRDDRLLLFVDLYPKSPRTFFYSMRAICSGEFTVPPVSAECMYNSPIAGSSSSGRMKIYRDK